MLRRRDEIQSVEEFSRFREALKEAVTPAHNPETQGAPFSYDTLPDDHRLGLTDTMMMNAGVGISQAGDLLGIETPTTLDQLHRRGEIFLYTSLGAAALFAAVDASHRLF